MCLCNKCLFTTLEGSLQKIWVPIKNSSSWLLRQRPHRRRSLICCSDHKFEESKVHVASRARISVKDSDWNFEASEVVFRPAFVLSAVCFLCGLTSWRWPPETANLMTNKIKGSQSVRRPVSFKYFTDIQCHKYTKTLFTVLLSKLFGLLIRHVSLSLQVGLVTDQDDHLETPEQLPVRPFLKSNKSPHFKG